MSTKEKNAESELKIKSKFSKKQLISAKRFQNRKDAVTAVLSEYSDSEMFSVSEVEQKLDNYMKGKVK